MISDWSDDSMKYLNEEVGVSVDGKWMSVVQGDENNAMPKSNITRAEALVMMDRASVSTDMPDSK